MTNGCYYMLITISSGEVFVRHRARCAKSGYHGKAVLITAPVTEIWLNVCSFSFEADSQNCQWELDAHSQ